MEKGTLIIFSLCVQFLLDEAWWECDFEMSNVITDKNQSRGNGAPCLI